MIDGRRHPAPRPAAEASQGFLGGLIAINPERPLGMASWT